MPKTIFFFADSALELIPRELYNNDIIKRDASKKNKKPSQIILDSSYHHIPMKKLSNFKKRGRPDIIHLCLLNLIESTFVLTNPTLIEIYVHTINNTIMEIKPYTRLPKNIERFKGLMTQLFNQQQIKADDKLLMHILEKENSQSILKTIHPENRYLFSSKGKDINITKIFEDNSKNDLAFIIGAFPYGNFSPQINNLTQNMVSIFPESLNAWIVLNKVLFLRELTISQF